jgi:magnesium chelatase subunit I
MDSKSVYPFAAIVGQEGMKRSLILNVINPRLSGVLIRGEKGTSKSTAVRGLAEILPEMEVVKNCPFQRSPDEPADICRDCPVVECRAIVIGGDKPGTVMRTIRIVELPLGATEDRVVGTMDLEHALKTGEKKIEAGILAQAHRGILYVDEVNLLDDHVVDLLLDSAAMGVNTVEREGVSFSHPSDFILVGTMNPEEGELRPQLLDRFGLCVNIAGIKEADSRVEVMERRADYDLDAESFAERWTVESAEIAGKILDARKILSRVQSPRSLLKKIAEYCLELGVDGHRGDIITLKAAKTLAAYEGRGEVTEKDIERVLEVTLSHRVRRQPFQEVATDIMGFSGR